MKDILVLCDDYWHPAEVVELGMEFLRDRFRLHFVRDAKDILTPAYLRRFPAVVNCKSDQVNCGNDHPWFEPITEAGPRELRAYVEEGGGFLSLHAGNAFGKDNASGYPEFVGNYFVGHPPRCEMEVKVEREHPVTAGVADFAVRDEHYQIQVTAPDARVLLSTHSASGGDQVGGYVREMGAGRLCVLTPGHILSVWEHPQFRKLLENALRWCLKEN